MDARIDRKNLDRFEEEANSYAGSLLSGKPDIIYTASYNLNAEELAQNAINVGLRDKIDPGFIVLNYANGEGRFALANSSLKSLPGNFNPTEMIRNKMCERLNWDELTRENRDYLRRVTKIEPAK